jgi:hypothetical protein
MAKRFVRLVAAAICLVAPLGWVARADAGTTATVEITGQIVDTAMSLTLSTSSFSLGDVDATGNVYNPATSLAAPFEIGPDNGYFIPEGLAWVSKQTLGFTITSSVDWTLSYCSTTQSGTLDGATSLLFLALGMPPDAASAPAYIGSFASVTACSGLHASISGNGGADMETTVHPTYIVRATDTPHPFSATIQFTLSPI